LFRHTPPTALIVDDTQVFPAVIQHLARLGITAPQQVSLACMDSSSAFEWFRPSVTHITWDRGAVTKRVIAWANGLSRGKDDRKVTHIRATLVPGGTIGPVQKA